MRRMYRFLRYFRKYPYRKGAKQNEPYDFMDRGIDQEPFKSYVLYHKYFLETPIMKLRRYWRYVKKEYSSTPRGMKYEQLRMDKLKKVIEDCREHAYLDSTNPKLMLTAKGARFSDIGGIVFYNDLGEKYSTHTKIILGIIGGIPFGAIILWLIQKFL